MGAYPYRQPWRPLTRAVCGLRYVLHRSYPLRGYSTNGGPTHSDLLRFALTTRTLRSDHYDTIGLEERYLTDLFLGPWPAGALPRPVWSFSAEAKASSHRERGVSTSLSPSLRGLQQVVENILNDNLGAYKVFTKRVFPLEQFIERNERYCTYGEILSFINGIDARQNRLQISPSSTLHYLGIYYACLALSPSALEHHIRGYRAATDLALGPDESQRVVTALWSSLQTLAFQDPERNTRRLYGLITEPATDAPSLHEILCWSSNRVENKPGLGLYLSLLAHTNNEKVLSGTWEKYLRSTTDTSPFSHFEAAYIYALTLVEAGKSSDALDALTQLSERVWNTLPDLSRFQNLSKLLQDDTIAGALPAIAGEEQWQLILERQLWNMEQRLGLSWTRGIGLHKGLSDNLVASGKPIFTMDGNSPGYESPRRLVAEIRALGCSKSVSELSQIVELLDEYEGDLIPVVPNHKEGLEKEYYWLPQRSPIQLRGKISSTDLDGKQSLGLVRVVSSKDESPFAFAQSLHLIQLGYLKRGPPFSNDGSVIPPQLEETGYLMTWDRVSARFLAVFVGKELGLMEPTTQLQVNLDAPSEFFDAIQRITPLGYQDHHERIRFPTYRLELDPSPDLNFDMHT
ncbi:hypothetical protein BJX99DRAFT_132777 [Aspergillus californicus]